MVRIAVSVVAISDVNTVAEGSAAAVNIHHRMHGYIAVRLRCDILVVIGHTSNKHISPVGWGTKVTSDAAVLKPDLIIIPVRDGHIDIAAGAYGQLGNVIIILNY
jgi:hypothetical protein